MNRTTALLLLVAIPLLSCEHVTHEAHASATKWEKDEITSWGGSQNTTGADGFNNGSDHNASFQVGAQTAGTLFTGLFGYLATKAMYLTQQLQNASLASIQKAQIQADLSKTLAQLKANAVTGQQKNFAALIENGTINSTNVGHLRGQ